MQELDVGGLDGAFYQDTRSYLERRGVVWSEGRSTEGQLLWIKLSFPPGIQCEEVERSHQWTRKKILLPKDGLLYWNVRRSDNINRISVPIAYLFEGSKYDR